MASAEALLFSCSAVAFLLLARAAVLQPHRRRGGDLADLLLAALDSLLPEGRGLLDLATRRNMVLLCHAILVVILMDAGVLGAPARRRGAASAAAAGVEQGACAAPAHLAHAPGRSAVVWRRPRSSARTKSAGADESGRRLGKRQPRRSPRPAAAAALTVEPEQAERQPLVGREIVLVEKAPRIYLLDDDRDRAAVVELEQLAPGSATDARTDSDRAIIVAGDERNGIAEAEEMEGVELADDRRFDEFIEKQWSKIRQESLQLVRAAPQQQAITTW
ncbi:hypothetical protein GQ55_9G444600 [Panicum hallii var. hallii]|uniref:DUF4408 domain-containing protein n=1 Tax=Panicum hallii var. hallii TaxID=1504633 RepID=A0A2T7CBH8_9POAL|nr:hypothetical protein GQ55_9G444600 [Panicum hallii var. hallii]